MIENILRKHYPASPVPKISHEFKAAAAIATVPSATKVRYEVKPPPDIELSGIDFAKLQKDGDFWIERLTSEVDRVLAAMADRALAELLPGERMAYVHGRERGIAVRDGAAPIPDDIRRVQCAAYLRGYDEVMRAAGLSAAAKPADPLDAVIDGQKLRWLLSIDEQSRRETNTAAGVVVLIFTPAQRAAVSAHWSAQLRAKVAASEAERRARAPSVMMSIDPEDL